MPRLLVLTLVPLLLLLTVSSLDVSGTFPDEILSPGTFPEDNRNAEGSSISSKTYAETWDTYTNSKMEMALTLAKERRLQLTSRLLSSSTTEDQAGESKEGKEVVTIVVYDKVRGVMTHNLQ